VKKQDEKMIGRFLRL